MRIAKNISWLCKKETFFFGFSCATWVSYFNSQNKYNKYFAKYALNMAIGKQTKRTVMPIMLQEIADIKTYLEQKKVIVC